MNVDIPGYKLERQIGEGGMALVYLAIQENFNRPVAIKILVPGAEAERVQAERFLQEARTVATLNHPHIIPVYDVGQVDQYYYIAMEYLPGNTLKHWIKTGLLEEEICQVTQQIAEALHYAHGKGVIHRDIKPENIMFREDHSAVLTDFGIARSDKAQSNLTQEGMMIGTPAYMSPEQARGMSLDKRSDVYSLGVVFYEMLCKKQPYTAEDPIGVALAQVSEPVPTLPAQFGLYQEFLDKIMAKKPEDRFDSGLAVSKALKQLMSREPQQKSTSKEEAQAKTASKHKESEAAPSSVPKSNKAAFAENQRTDAVPEKNFSVEVIETKKAFFFKVSTISITVVSDDVSQFNIQFGQISQRLLDWHQQNGKKAKNVELTFFIKPWLLEKVESSIRQMVGTKDPYGFLTKTKISFVAKNLSGQILANNPDF